MVPSESVRHAGQPLRRLTPCVPGHATAPPPPPPPATAPAPSRALTPPAGSGRRSRSGVGGLEQRTPSVVHRYPGVRPGATKPSAISNVTTENGQPAHGDARPHGRRPRGLGPHGAPALVLRRRTARIDAGAVRVGRSGRPLRRPRADPGRRGRLLGQRRIGRGCPPGTLYRDQHHQWLRLRPPEDGEAVCSGTHSARPGSGRLANATSERIGRGWMPHSPAGPYLAILVGDSDLLDGSLPSACAAGEWRGGHARATRRRSGRSPHRHGRARRGYRGRGRIGKARRRTGRPG